MNPILVFKNFTQQLEYISDKQRLIPGTDNYFMPVNAGDSRGKATLAKTFEFAATRVEEFTAQINERNFSIPELREFQKSYHALKNWRVNVFTKHVIAKHQREKATGSLFYRIISLFSSFFFVTPYNKAVEKQNDHLAHSLAKFEYHMMLKVRLRLLHEDMQNGQSEIDRFFNPVNGECKKVVEKMATVENPDVETVIAYFAFFVRTFANFSNYVQRKIPSSLVTEETIHVGKLGIAQEEEIAKLQGYKSVLSLLASAAFDMRHSIEGDRQKCQPPFIQEEEVEGRALMEINRLKLNLDVYEGGRLSNEQKLLCWEKIDALWNHLGSLHPPLELEETLKAQYLKIQNTSKPTFPLKVELNSPFLSASVEVHDLAELKNLGSIVNAMASELEKFGIALRTACVRLSHLESILREGKAELPQQELRMKG